jgi:hypothetical protein
MEPTMMRPLLAASFCAFALSFAAPAVAQKAAAPAAGTAGKELSADEIVEKALGKGAVGFRQGTATIKMTIVSAKGEAKERTLDVKAMRGEDGN